MNNHIEIPDSIEIQLRNITDWWKKRSASRFILAAMWSIPWIWWLLSTISAKNWEKEQWQINQLQQLWIEEHEEKIKWLWKAFYQILSRFNEFDDEIQKRIESPSYLNLVRKWFTTWDNADTEEKREMIRKLLTNAWAEKLCPDDLVRLFIDWIDNYHESHFKVIKEIYQKSWITRESIWSNIDWKNVREDSSEADLFRLLIRDLSTWWIIRQKKQIDSSWNFIKKTPKKNKFQTNKMESVFENTKPYELTELGKEFVHYTMEEVITKIG